MKERKMDVDAVITKSDGFEKTWTFLDRRIADVMRVPQVLGALRERLGGALKQFRPFAPR